MNLIDVPVRSKPSRRLRLITGGCAVVVVAALALLAWRLTHPDAAGGPRGAAGKDFRPSTTVGVATATATDVPVVLEALGTVLPAAIVTVRPQVGGVLQKILFREGETVRAGQVLATIDPRQFEMVLMQTGGQRQRDEAQLASAKVTLQRFQGLLAQDSIARQEVDTQAALVKQLEGTVMSDWASEGSARLNLGYSKIIAPISGRVGLRVVDVGNVVSTNDAAGIVVITQTAPIDVQFAVPQDQVHEVLARTASGDRLSVTALDRNRSSTLATGVFSTLDNQIDLQTGTVRAKARFANDQQTLFPNQFVNVRLLLRTITGAVTVPVTALRHGAKGDYVYVLDAPTHTVALRLVEHGQASVDKIEITTGLKVGEQVITEGADRLIDGASVTLVGDKPGMPGAGGQGKGKGKGRRPAAP
jgi:multidrug efflux system membrane fusion protein